jgi:tripartite-type tricarboxylate transporter receptor subunit TctC
MRIARNPVFSTIAAGLVVAAGLLAGAGQPAIAQGTPSSPPQSEAASGYPDKPIHLVIPFAAGGGNDIVARIVGGKLAEAWGQPVLVENKPGAQGIVAVEYVRKSAPDGLTVLMGPSGPTTGNPAIYEKLPYSTLRDFIPVTMISSFPLILVVNASLPVKSVTDLVRYAKEHPNSVNYGSTAALFQLASELFNQKTGTHFQHIPYKSSGDFVNAVLANEVTIAFADPPPATGPLRAGRLRALAVTSATRNHALPDVPTLAEAGVPGMTFTLWMGIFVPTGTASAIVQRLHDEIARIVALPDVVERFAALGVDPVGMPSAEFAKVVADDIARWTAVAKAANIKAEQ